VQQCEADRRDPDCGHVDQRIPTEIPGHGGHQRKRCDVDAIEDACRKRGPLELGQQRPADRHVNERRQEDRDRGHCGTGDTGQLIADEGRRREHGAGRHLTDGDRVEQLLLGEPMQPFDEIGAEEGQEDIATAEQQSARFEEHEEETRE